jgi:hypothetical protein
MIDGKKRACANAGMCVDDSHIGNFRFYNRSAKRAELPSFSTSHYREVLLVSMQSTP